MVSGLVAPETELGPPTASGPNGLAHQPYSGVMDQRDEDQFIEQARQRIREHAQTRREAGYTDKLYAVAQSDSGTLSVGIPLETSMSQFDVCAERHAINNMLYAEPDATLAAMLVATPAPDETSQPATPCGACRHAIQEFSENCPVYCTTFVREESGWTMFPQRARYTAERLYPDHQGHPSWD